MAEDQHPKPQINVQGYDDGNTRWLPIAVDSNGRLEIVLV